MISLNTFRSTLKAVRDVLSIAAVPRWLLLSVVFFGVTAALADGLSTSLIVLLLYSLMDHTSEILSTNVFISKVVSWVNLGFDNHIILMLLLVCLLFLNMGLTFCYTVINAQIRHRVIETVRNRINSQFLEVSYDFILRHDRGYLLNMWASDSWSMGDVYLFSGRILVNLCASAVFFLLLLAISAKLLAISLIGTAVLFIGMHRFAKPARDLGRKMKKGHEKITERMLVTLQGMRALRAFGEEARYQKGFEIASAGVRETCIAFERLHALVSPAVHVGYLLLLVAIVFIGNPMGVTFVATLAFVALLYRFQPYVRELRSNLLLIAQLQTSVASVIGILDRSDKIYIRSGSSTFCGLKDEIRFERVSFTYAGAPAPSLDGVSFAIPAGSVTAFVGMSGAGKTTIVNLLLGLYQPNTGQILVDGIPLDELSRTNWLSKIASAGQDVELVEGTIGDNLRLAQPDADVSAMRAAANAVNMLETIENLSDGFDCWIGQQGLKLSGGQRQRLGLARALLRDPDILILDEATNSLNSSLESEIWAGIRRRMTGRTFVLITHRPETAMTADQVICIDSGRVIEVVSRTELQANPRSVSWTFLRDAGDGRQSRSSLSQAED